MEMLSEVSNKESNVGRKLTDATTKKLIMLVLFVLFTNPLFHLDTYMKWPDGHSYGMGLMQQLDPSGPIMDTIFD